MQLSIISQESKNIFDIDREGTGTAEWATYCENIQTGCANDCLYCYAAQMASRFKRRTREEWRTEELTKKVNRTSYPKRDGVIMMPSSHDITPFSVNSYIRLAKLILAAGNHLLIVSKPRIECITAILTELEPWKEQILFRFTIGSMNEATCAFWEPGAPTPGERICSLRTAYEVGFKTSVSIEPILGGIENAIDVVNTATPFVSDTIWIGKMNRIRERVASVHYAAIDNIDFLQRDEMIMQLFHHLKSNPLIRWKDSIKKVLADYAISKPNGPT